MAINNNTNGKLKYIFYVVILLFLISNVSAVSHTGDVDLQLSVSASDWSLLDGHIYGTGISIDGFRYKGVADAGIPDTIIFRDADMSKAAAYAWADIPQNVGGSFVLYDNGVFAGTGGITVHRVNDVDVGRVDIWYQFDDTDFVVNVSETTMDVTLYASPISEYYSQFRLDYYGNPYTTQNVYIRLKSGSYTGTHASWSTGGSSYVEYDYYGHFINEYNITLSGATASTVITRDGLGQQLSSSRFKLKNSTGSTVYLPASYSTTNSTHNHDNGSYYYYLDVENYGDVLIYDAITTPPPPPQTEDTIEWGADAYVVDDTGSYSWSLSDSNWDTWLYSKKASIYRGETMVHEVSLPTQTGTFYYTFEEEGSYTVKLRHTSFLLPHVTIDSDTVIVSVIGESFISVINNTIYINTPIGFQFSYGFTPLPVSPGVWSSLTSIEARKLIDGDWIPVNRWFYPDLGNVTPSVLYTYTIGTTGAYSDSPLTSEGDYMFYLTDLNHGDVASTSVYTVEYKPGVPSDNITTTYLNITLGESYLINDQFAFNYGIDNTNFTTGTNYMEIYNYDYDITTQSALLYRQEWYKYGIIYPVGIYDPIESFEWGGIVALPGNNKMLIRHDDINGSTELVHDNFTLSEISTGGYGLKLSTYEACINEPVLIHVTIPSAANLTIYSPTGNVIKNYNLNASTTITYYFPVSGQYNLELIPSGSNSAENVATIFISDCAEDDIIEPPSGEMDDMYINMFNAMTIPAFWGMIIFIGFIGGLAIKRDKNGDALVSGNGLAFIAFGLLNLLSIIGLFAPYTFYIIVSTWIFAGMFFGVGKYLARGEG